MRVSSYDVTPSKHGYQYVILSDSLTCDSSQKLLNPSADKAIRLENVSVKVGGYFTTGHRRSSLWRLVDQKSVYSLNTDCEHNPDFFIDNYEQIMRGEVPNWVLYIIRIDYDQLEFAYLDLDHPNDMGLRHAEVVIRADGIPKNIQFTAAVSQSHGQPTETYKVQWAHNHWATYRSSNGEDPEIEREDELKVEPYSNFDVTEFVNGAKRKHLKFVRSSLADQQGICHVQEFQRV